MWRDPRDTSTLQILCPKCDGLCVALHSENVSIRVCETCNKPRRFFKCLQSDCGFYERICPDCYIKPSTPNKSRSIEDNFEKSWINSYFLSIFVIALLSLIIFALHPFLYKTTGNDVVSLVENLKKNYPSQKNETWFHILGVLEQKIPAVKSITLLHGKDEKTCGCLTNDLIYLYTKNKNIKNEEFTFSDFEADDYGFLLKHYHAIVKKFRVFVTNLNNVPGNVAPIFQTLCDEVSSDIKPSLFIFTLKYDDKSERLKPLERATTLLKRAWNKLPENELFPLLSRVVKNVVDIVPEHKINC